MNMLASRAMKVPGKKPRRVPEASEGRGWDGRTLPLRVDDLEVREAAARYDLEPSRVVDLFEAGRRLPAEGLEVVRAMVLLTTRAGASAAVPWLVGIRRALESACEGEACGQASAIHPDAVDSDSVPADDVSSDDWDMLDAPISVSKRAEVMVRAEAERERRRRGLLRVSVGVTEAAELTGRSRQAIERLRRQGRALALRVGSRWRYPRFQLSADSPGGIVPGLGRVLPALGMSPVGAAWWLTRPLVDLGDRSPIELLHAGQIDRVAEAASVAGRVP